MYNEADDTPRSDYNRKTLGKYIRENPKRFGKGATKIVMPKKKTSVSQLCARLTGIINFNYKTVRPYLAGTVWDKNKNDVGDEFNRAVHQPKEAPFKVSHRSIEDPENPGKKNNKIVPVRDSLVDEHGFLHDKATMRSIARPRGEYERKVDRELTKGEAYDPASVVDISRDYVRPTEAYAVAKTNAIMKSSKRQGELNDKLRGVPSGDVQKTTKDFRDAIAVETGESYGRYMKEAMRAEHGKNINTIRGHIAHDAREGRAILQSHNKHFGYSTILKRTHKNDVRQSVRKSVPMSKAPEVIARARENLGILEDHHAQTHLDLHKKAMGELRGFLGEKIQNRHIKGNGAGVKMSPNELHDEVDKYIKPFENPIHHSVDLEKHYGHVADLIGKKPEFVKGIHQHLVNLRAEAGEGGRAAARKKFISNGAVFNDELVSHIKTASKGVFKTASKGVFKAAPKMEGHPILRNTGLGLAAAGATGIGVVAYRRHKNKQAEKKLSVRGNVIQFMTPEMKSILSKARLPKLTKYAKRLVDKAPEPVTIAEALAKKHGVVHVSTATESPAVQKYRRYAKEAGVSDENIESRIAKQQINEEAANDFKKPVFEDGDYHRRQQRVRSAGERDEEHGASAEIEEAIQKRAATKRSAKQSEIDKRHNREIGKFQGQLKQAKQIAEFRGKRLIEIRRAGKNHIANNKLAHQAGHDEASALAAEAIQGIKSRHGDEIKGLRSAHSAELKKGKSRSNKLIAGGTVAGGGIGYVAGRKRDDKKIKMNSRFNPIRFGIAEEAGNITKWVRSKDTLPLAGGIMAADAATNTASPNKGETRGQGFRRGLGQGAIYGGTLVAAEPLIKKGLQKAGVVAKDVAETAMRSRIRPIYFTAKNKVSVAQDRYRKQIHEREQMRSESNYTRSALGGSALGAALKGRMKASTHGRAALIGAGAGIAAQALVRASDRGTRDQFGDRSYTSKRIEKIPYQAAGLAAAGIAGKRIYNRTKGAKGMFDAVKRLSSKSKLIRFDESWGDQVVRQRRSKEAIAIDKIQDVSKRGGRLLRDIHAKIKGEKVLDKRGREKTKEWERPWVKKALTGAIVTGTAGALVGLRKVSGSGVQGKLGRLLNQAKTGKATLAAHDLLREKVPGYGKVSDKLSSFRKRLGSEVNDVVDNSKGLDRVSDAIDRRAARAVAPKIAPKIEPLETHVVPNADGTSTTIPVGTPGYFKHMKENEGVYAAQAARDRIRANKSAVTHIGGLEKTEPKKFASRNRGIIKFRSKEYDDQWEGWLRQRPGAYERKERSDSGESKKFWKDIRNRAGLGGALVTGAGLGMLLKKHPNFHQAQEVGNKIVNIR